MPYIYITTNTINGKIYIGQKSTNSTTYIGGGVLLNQAIKKYGRENFTHDILLECDESQLDAFEIAYIWLYNSTDRSIGYNVQTGGAYNTSEISRYNMRVGRKGIIFSESHRYNLSIRLKGRLRKESTISKWKISRSGYIHLESTKEKISKSQIGGLKSKLVYQLDINTGDVVGIYKGGTELLNNGFNQSKVSACALGKRKTHKGFRWSYVVN